MNQYQVNEKYKIDYGNKVTIWANCGPIDDENKDKGNYINFLYLPPIWNNKIYGNCIKDLNKICTFNVLELRKRMYEETGIYTASNGMHLIWLIKDINPDFSQDDCFGFSFKEKDVKENWAHYTDLNYDGKEFHLLKLEKNAIEKKLMQ